MRNKNRSRSAAAAAALLILTCSSYTNPSSAFVVVVNPSSLSSPRHYRRRRQRGYYRDNSNNNENDRPLIIPTAAAKRRTSGSDDDDDDDDGITGATSDDDDWRAFRARLVRNGLRYLGDDDDDASDADPPAATTTTDSSYAHECTPLVETGTVLLSVPTTDLCQALEQQFWHRGVVLVTDVSEDVNRGEEERMVAESELAPGAGRGRWSYRGVFLNRMMTTSDGMWRDEEGWGGGVMWGGDLGGRDLDDDDAAGGRTPTVVTCLHGLDLSDPEVRKVSTPVLNNLSVISLPDAKRLCLVAGGSRYRASDFYTFGGFCSWRPGQLEREMGEDREEWIALSVDGRSILEEMRRQRDVVLEMGTAAATGRNVLECCTGTWRKFLGMIDWSESRATERLPAGQLNFYDEMLEIWVEEKLCVFSKDDNDGVVGNSSRRDSSRSIGSGTLLRATGLVSNDVLLFDQEFIGSLVLVLEDTDSATVGVILNHVLPAGAELSEDVAALPLRYGGPIDVPSWKSGDYLDDGGFDSGDDEMHEGFVEYYGKEMDRLFVNDNDDIYNDMYNDDDDDNDSSFIWIHRDVVLGSRGPDNGGGSPLGTSGLWLIKETDAVHALHSRTLSPKDVMIFSGVCIWEKAPHLGTCQGGLREQIDGLESFQIVRAYNDETAAGKQNVIRTVWDILAERQGILTKETLDDTIDATLDAWAACNQEVNAPPQDETAFRLELSHAALRAWVGVNLLMDPLTTFVEVKNASR